MTWRTGDDALYVGDRPGRIWRVRDDRVEPKPVLDLSDEVSFGGDRGLSGIAFSPDGTELFAVFTDLEVDVRLVAFAFGDRGVVRSSRRNLLSVPQPTIRHHGGDIHFGPDGDLYLSLGDGNEGDPLDQAQALDTLLGKLVRIDPTPSAGRAYTIPPDNPFVHRKGARPEIWAYGLRNPWRFAFDRATGDLWLGDVGQFDREELDFLPAGQGAGSNFGWSRLEGSKPIHGASLRDSVLPLREYAHTHGRCAVMGGLVYRGSRIASLQGAYVYNDYCDGKIRALVERNGRFEFERKLGAQLDGLSSFGEGPDGEIYALSLFKGVFRLDPAGG